QHGRHRSKGSTFVTTAAVSERSNSFARDLVMLTKPRIISLLLVTTVAPMYVAGSPSFGLVCWVLLAGYLMAGGANAVNMFIDSDIDGHMARTRLRPIPSGRMDRRAVLAFGILLATCATAVFAIEVNLASAARAFPPLVGWASVTGHVDLAAIYLFLIVFYWTPPHFWALALNKQVDYKRAGVPMAPLVWGERETMWNMLWYTFILIALTLLPA